MNNALIIVKWHSDLEEAKRLAEDEYAFCFEKQHPSWAVTKKTVTILRELRADQGLVGYHIRTGCEPSMAEVLL